MNGIDEQQRLKAGGFSDEEIGTWTVGTSQKLADAGFRQDEIDTYFGQPPFDPAPVKAHVDEAVKQATAPAAEGGQPKPVKDFTEALSSGFFDNSISSLLAGPPKTTLATDAPRSSRIASNIGSLAGDMPFLAAGYVIGGANPITGTAGAVGLQAGMRRILMDKYEKGEVSTWTDFWERASGAVTDTLKGLVVGGVTGAAGKAVGLAPVMMSNTAKAAVTLGVEIPTMVTVGSALEGKIPNADEFIDTALTLGFLKGTHVAAGKLRKIYAETGVKPDEVAQDMQKDPTILHDLAAENKPIPDAYQSAVEPPVRTAENNAANNKQYQSWFDSRVKEMQQENVGQGVLDTIDEMGRSPKDVVGEFWKNTYPGLPPEVQARFEKYITRVTGFKPGSVVAANKDGVSITAKNWEETYPAADLPNLAEHLEGTERGLIALMEMARLGMESGAFKESKQTRPPIHGVEEWTPDQAMGGGAPPKSPGLAGPTATPAQQKNIPLKEAQQSVLDRIVQKDEETATHTFDDLYTSVVDNLNPIRSALKAGGKADLETAENPYSLERLTRGTMGKGLEFLKYGAFDFKGYKTVTRGYEQILAPVKKDLDGFRAYMVSKRVIEKAGQGIETGIPIEEARTVVREGKAKYEAIHQERLRYRETLLDYMKDSGILSEKAVDAMRAANKDYVPFHRFFEGHEGTPSSSRSVRNPVKRMKGGVEQIIDPIVSDIKDTFLFIGLAEKNAARQTFVKLGPDFAVKQAQPIQATRLVEAEIRNMFDEFLSYRKETVKTKTETSTTTGAAGQPAAAPTKAARLMEEKLHEALKSRGYAIGEADQIIRRVVESKSGQAGSTTEKIIKEIESTTYIPELDIRLPNEAATIFRAIQAPVKNDEIAVFTNGKREVYQVDPKVAEAFQDQDRISTNFLTDMLVHTPASLLRAGVIVTPEYITRNIMRDAVSAFIYSGSNPVKTALGLKSIVTKDTAYHNWLKGGGGNATMVAIDRDYIHNEIMHMGLETGLMQRAWNVAKTPIEILRATAELVENATRIGAVRSELMHAKTKAQIQALSMIAREATVDFARHGRDTQEFAKATAFANPTIQGIDRFAREMKEHPIGATAKAMAAVTIPSLLLWWANKDDKEIQDLPAWQHYTFMMTRVPLPGGDSFILRIPYAQEFGILFGAIPTRMMDAYINENPDALKGLDTALIQAFTPSVIPTAAVPLLEQATNQRTMGGPIIPADREKLLPEYQYTPYTTELTKAMGQIIGAFPGMEHAAVYNQETAIGGIARALTTPALMENYVRSWTGGTGIYLLQLADKGLRVAGVLPDPVKPAWDLADYPVIKAFVARYPSANTQSIRSFFEEYEGSKKYYQTFQFLASQGDVKAQAFLEDHATDLVQFDEVKAALTDHSKLIRMIQKNPEIPAEEQKQLIDTMYWRMIELSKGGIEGMRLVREQMQAVKP